MLRARDTCLNSNQSYTLQAWQATVGPFPSQTLVRYQLVLTHTDMYVENVPFSSDAVPVRSFFVYDGELPAETTAMWAFGHAWKLRATKPHTPIASKVRPVTVR